MDVKLLRSFMHTFDMGRFFYPEAKRHWKSYQIVWRSSLYIIEATLRNDMALEMFMYNIILCLTYVYLSDDI